jgi:transposase
MLATAPPQSDWLPKARHSSAAVLIDTQAEAGNRDQIYPESRFVYQPQSDTYLCPAGELMRPRRCHPKRLTWVYVTKSGTCLLCHLRALCTRSKTGPTIHRHREQTLSDAAKQQASSAAGLPDRKRRQHLMERSFADSANRYGFKRAR